MPMALNTALVIIVLGSSAAGRAPATDRTTSNHLGLARQPDGAPLAAGRSACLPFAVGWLRLLGTAAWPL